MHRDILTPEQIKILNILKIFSGNFGLVGGTAIALHLGHRRSIDFDLFSEKEFKNTFLGNKIIKNGCKINNVIVSKEGEYTIIINRVKLTFYHYPFKINYPERLPGYIKIPDLLTLAAMKIYALGYRAKWKDYVDLYFIQKKYGVGKIIKRAEEIYQDAFNEKLIRGQLSYFKDINYSEKIEFMPGFEVKDEIIKKELIKISLEK